VSTSSLKLGSAPDSWGVWFPADPRQTPWSRFLDEIAEAGYHWTELGPFGYLPTDPDVLARELSARGLGLAGGFVKFDLEDDEAWRRAEPELEELGPFLRRLGGEYLVILDELYTDEATGADRVPPTLDDASWRRLCETMRRVMEASERHGLRPVFHPHAQSHVEYEDQIERLLDDVDGLQLCFDVGHHAYCGGDPVRFYERHADRIPYLHLKSVDAELRERVARDGLSFTAAVAEGVFVEPSLGSVDFERLRDLMAAAGYDGYAIVEQDMYPAEFDRPLPIARRTHAYLTGLGLG
jgi:inosose dehydratase